MSNFSSTDTSTEEPQPKGRPGLPTTPLFAVVGVTDLALRQVRAAAAGAVAVQQRFQSDIEARLAEVEKRVGGLDPKSLRAQAEQAPTFAMARALEAKVRAEAAYEELARRGKDLVDRVSTQPETQTFRTQAETTLNRGRAAVTVARRAADGTASVIRGSLVNGRNGVVVAPVDAPAGVNEPAKLDVAAVEKAVAAGDGGDKPVPRVRPAKKATVTTRKSAAAVKGVAPAEPAATGVTPGVAKTPRAPRAPRTPRTPKITD
ncbi:hypothetical protein [Kineosporia succinea]|uniref:Heparin binding hemagglutinin HbhA n=1 Tax=Kineosporia succinea TaxID=84632 RepID=A0ABT9P353_9ACTN|nr:hypothetical protein [Kineosporia succinea]MDP9826996.1 hypothetical protein [Kineosporia succinea]